MKTREEQIEEMAKEMCKEYGTALCRECDSYGERANKFIAEKLYDAGYRKQSDTVREFVVKKISKVAFEMHLTAKDAHQGRNQADAQQAYGAMDAIAKLMAQIIVLAAEYDAGEEE